MLRAARMVDIPALMPLLELHAERTRYAGTLKIDERAARQMLGQAIGRNGHTKLGGALVNVIEVDGEIKALMIGLLDRVYAIFDALVAQDLVLVAHDDAPPLAVRQLISAYLDWAQRNPLVFETNLSWTDVVPGAERLGPFYARIGFEKSGELFRRPNPGFGVERKAAA